jgi:hypothetical protein
VLIRFESTVDDLAAWAVYHFERSGNLRVIVAISLVFGPLAMIGLLLVIFLTPLSEGLGPLYDITLAICSIFVLMFCVIWFIKSPERCRNAARKSTFKRVQRQYSRTTTTGLVGIRELELTETALVSRSSIGESYYRISAIENVVSTDDHTFILLNSFTALVLPRDGVIDGDYNSFVSALHRRIPGDQV